MDMSKEEFVYFVRRAMDDANSDERTILYNFLVRCFTDADKDCSGTVEFEEFDKMIDTAAALPRKYGYAPTNKESYAGEGAKLEARKKLFAKIDKQGTKAITLEAWVGYAMGHILAKVRGLTPHVLVDGTKQEFLAFIRKAVVKTNPEYKELYFYLLKVFQDADRDHDGAVKFEEFDAMIEIAADMPRKHGLAPTSEEAYKSEDERKAARKKMFDRMNVRKDGHISFDEWLNYAVTHIAEKITTVKTEMDMTKDEFIHFARIASNDPKSDARVEMQRFLVRCFTSADTDYDGLVTFDQFDRMVDLAAAMPRKHGLAPTNEQSYKTDDDRIKARKLLFAKIDTKNTGAITLEAWVKYAMSHIIEKVATQKPHVLVEGTKDEFIAFVKKAVVKTNPEYKELYFYLLKVFQDADRDHDGAVNFGEFDAMIEIAAAMPRRHGLAPASLPKEQRSASRLKMFKTMDVNNDGTISFDEWLNYAVKHIAEKAAGL